MPKTFSIVICLALAVPSAAHAQGIWLQKGVSGVGAELDVSRDSSTTSSFAVRGGYSYQGFLDAGLSLGTVDISTALPDLKVYTLGVGLTYHPVKQTRDTPVSLSVGASYSRGFFSSDTLSANDESLSQWVTTLGGGVYRFFPLAPRIGVTPAIELAWLHSSTTDAVFDQSRTLMEDQFVIALSAGLAYLDSAGHIWGVSPSLSFGPGDTPTGFGLSVAFITTIPGAR